MGAIEKGSLVLVTGASGFVASYVFHSGADSILKRGLIDEASVGTDESSSHIVRELLRSGFRVRGTVRSESQGRYLEDLFNKEGVEGSFFYVVVPDMTKVRKLPRLIVLSISMWD